MLEIGGTEVLMKKYLLSVVFMSCGLVYAGQDVGVTGTYQGFVKCTDCMETLTQLILKDNLTFTKTDVYLTDEKVPVETEGDYKLSSEGDYLTLIFKDGKRVQYQVLQDQGAMKLSTQKSSVLNKLKEGHTISFDLGFPVKGILMDDGISMTFQPCGYENVYRLLGKNWRSKPVFDSESLKQPYRPMVAKLFVQYKAQQNIGDGGYCRDE